MSFEPSLTHNTISAFHFYNQSKYFEHSSMDMHLETIPSGKFGSLDIMFGGDDGSHSYHEQTVIWLMLSKMPLCLMLIVHHITFFSHNLNKKSMKTIKEA